MSKQFYFKQLSLYKNVLFQAIHFSINTQYSSIWPIDKTLSGDTIPVQSRPESDGNKGLLCIPRNPSITGTSPSDCLESYPGHPLVGESYPSTDRQLVYSIARADRANKEGRGERRKQWTKEGRKAIWMRRKERRKNKRDKKEMDEKCWVGKKEGRWKGKKKEEERKKEKSKGRKWKRND